MPQRRTSLKNKKSLGSFDSTLSDLSLLDDDELLLSSFAAKIGETDSEIDVKRTSSIAPYRGLIINGTCFSITAILGVLCILVAYLNDPEAEAIASKGRVDPGCPQKWETWLYTYGVSIIFVQILSAASLICQRSAMGTTNNEQSGFCATARRRVWGRVLFIVVQFLQVPLLAWIAYGCFIFFRYPLNCNNSQCPGQICIFCDDQSSGNTNSSVVRPIYESTTARTLPPSPWVMTTTAGPHPWVTTTTTTPTVTPLVNNTPAHSEAISSAWPQACVREHEFGWVLLLVVVLMTLCSWVLTIMILVCSMIARRQQQAAAYEAQSNLDDIDNLIFSDGMASKYSPQFTTSPKHPVVSDKEAWRMM